MDEFDELSDAEIDALTEFDEMGKGFSNSIADNRRVGGLSRHRRAQVIALGGER